jgi:hypothetical protein
MVRREGEEAGELPVWLCWEAPGMACGDDAAWPLLVLLGLPEAAPPLWLKRELWSAVLDCCWMEVRISAGTSKIRREVRLQAQEQGCKVGNTQCDMLGCKSRVHIARLRCGESNAVWIAVRRTPPFGSITGRCGPSDSRM